MTHLQAARLLDHHRHGIKLAETEAYASQLLAEALALLEADRAEFRNLGVPAFVPTAAEAARA